MMRNRKPRAFISIYFPDGITDRRRKRDFTISFDSKDGLYEICKKLGSSGIKELIQVHSYKELIWKANEDQRSLGNYIKRQVKRAIGNEADNTVG